MKTNASNNREKLFNKLNTNEIAIIPASTKALRNGDQFYFPFRQNSDFYYLTGINTANHLLILYKNNTGNKKSLLFLYTPSEKEKIYDGDFLTPTEALNISGVDYVYSLDELKKGFLDDLFEVSVQVYLCERNTILDEKFLEILNTIKQHSYLPLRNIIDELRLIKTDEEIRNIKTAIQITHEALNYAVEQLKYAKTEREIYASLIAYYLSHENTGVAFEPIVAFDKNAVTLHYTKLTSAIKSGGLILIDTGAEYNLYAGDITRVFPVNGKFNDKQKAVYNEVLGVKNNITELIKPGTTINRLNEKADKLIAKSLVKLGLLTENEASKKENVKKYFPHGLSHFVGLDVHDSGSKKTILQPNMVLTCEPGIYIPEWHIGIRLEDDLLITENGNINLSEDIPIKADEIEKWVLG